MNALRRPVQNKTFLNMLQRVSVILGILGYLNDTTNEGEHGGPYLEDQTLK